MKLTKNTKQIEILTPNGFKHFDGIQTQKKVVLKFSFENYPEKLICTLDHLINYDDTLTNFKRADEFKKGDLISHNELGYLTIKSIRKLKDKKVYDILSVKDVTSIYLSNGIKSHNCSFIGSNKTLLNGETLQDLMGVTVSPIDYKHNHQFKIYEAPIQGVEYILGIDPSDGVGGDSATIQVLKITSPQPEKGIYYKLEQVGVFSSNLVKPKDFAQVAVGIGKWYNNAWLMAENNNSCGGLTCHFLWNEFSYSNMVNPDWRDKRQPGINANRGSKYRGNMMMRDMIETRQIKLIDQTTIEELSRYEEQGPDLYAAAAGAHDDHVMSLLWAIAFLDTKWYSGYGEDFGREILEEYEIEAPKAINASKYQQKQKEAPQDLYSTLMQNSKNRMVKTK